MQDADSSSPRVSMRDIAKQVGVSHTTVSMALRNQTRISEQVRRKVRDCAEELGYWPDPMLTALKCYRQAKVDAPIHAAIAWINVWPQPDDLRSQKEFDGYWNGASRAAKKCGYRLEEFRLAGINPLQLHQILRARGICCILLPPEFHIPGPEWSAFPWDEYYIVRFGRAVQTPRCQSVTADQMANAGLAYEKIKERGYRRIGFVTDGSNPQLHSNHHHLGGFVMAQWLRDRGDAVPVLALGKVHPGQGSVALAEWIGRYRVDAIFTDLATVPEMLKIAGLKVPEDIALASTSLLDTPISAGIDQYPEEVGRVAFLILNSLVNDGARGPRQIFHQTLVVGAWVDGASLPIRHAAPEA